MVHVFTLDDEFSTGNTSLLLVHSLFHYKRSIFCTYRVLQTTVQVGHTNNATFYFRSRYTSCLHTNKSRQRIFSGSLVRRRRRRRTVFIASLMSGCMSVHQVPVPYLPRLYPVPYLPLLFRKVQPLHISNWPPRIFIFPYLK